MWTQDNPFRIVVAIDFDTAAESTLERALLLATGQQHAEVHPLVVVPPRAGGTGTPPDAGARINELTKETIRKLNEAGNPVRVDHVVTHVLSGKPEEEIVWLAAYLDADLVVVGTHGRTGIGRLVLGSVAERVARGAGCPVMVVRPKNHDATWKAPEVEPPCRDCESRREATGRRELWCERHQGHHRRTHTVHFADHSSSDSFRPWGFVER